MIKNIVIATLLLLLAGGGGYFYFGGVAGLQKWVGTAAADNKPPQPELQLYNIEKVLLTLPDADKNKMHHAQLDVVITSFDPKAVATLQKLDPLLRNVVVETFSNKAFQQVNEMKDIGKFQMEVQAAFVATLVKYKINLELLDVKFSKMVMQ